MQERKIDDNKIWEAYYSFISGESITNISRQIGINRGTLTKYIETVVLPNLKKDELSAYKEKIKAGFKGNLTKRQHIGKKEGAVLNVNLSESIGKLAQMGVTPEQVEELYSILRENKHTACAKDTFIFKCLEHLTFLESIGVSEREAFDLFIAKPKAFNSDTKKLKERYEHLFRETGSRDEAREILLRNPRGRNNSLGDNVTFKNNHSVNNDSTVEYQDTGRGED